MWGYYPFAFSICWDFCKWCFNVLRVCSELLMFCSPFSNVVVSVCYILLGLFLIVYIIITVFSLCGDLRFMTGLGQFLVS